MVNSRKRAASGRRATRVISLAAQSVAASLSEENLCERCSPSEQAAADGGVADDEVADDEVADGGAAERFLAGNKIFLFSYSLIKLRNFG